MDQKLLVALVVVVVLLIAFMVYRKEKGSHASSTSMMAGAPTPINPPILGINDLLVNQTGVSIVLNESWQYLGKQPLPYCKSSQKTLAHGQSVALNWGNPPDFQSPQCDNHTVTVGSCKIELNPFLGDYYKNTVVLTKNSSGVLVSVTATNAQGAVVHKTSQQFSC